MPPDSSSASTNKNFLNLVETYGVHKSELLSVARRLPNIAGQSLSGLQVDELTEPRLKAAFASYGAEHEKDDVLQAWAAWDGFFSYLVAAGVASDNPMARIAKPPSRRVSVMNVVESGVFKTVLASLLVPAMLFFFTERSKVANSLQQAQEERARNTRIELVAQTSGLLESISQISAELIHSGSGGPLPRDITDRLRRDLRNMIGPAEAALGSWTREFPIITEEDANNFIEILNVQFSAVESVAYYLSHPATDEAKARELRGQLAIIEHNVRGILRYEALGMLNCLVDIADDREERACGTATTEAAEEKVDLMRDSLALIANELLFFKLEFLPPVHTAEDSTATDVFERRLREYALLRAEREARNPYEASTPEEQQAFDELRVALSNIDLRSRLEAHTVNYSSEYLGQLAEYFEVMVYAQWQVPKCPYDSDPPQFCFPE